MNEGMNNDVGFTVLGSVGVSEAFSISSYDTML
jgi:hypothetical protein